MSKYYHTHLFSHVVPVLSRMNTSLQRCSPGCSVHSGSLVFWTGDRLPIDEERYSVFCLWYTVVGFPCRYPCRSARNNASWHGLALQDPTTDINVMR